MNFAELAAPESSDAKRAALMVHAMSPADRDWVLSRLPEQQRHSLEGLLAELASLGVAQEPEFITSALHQSSAAPSQRSELAARFETGMEPCELGLTDEEYLVALTPAAVERLSRLWSTEPAALVAMALKAHPWPWHTQLMERLPVLHRRKVEGMLALEPPYPGTELAKAILHVTRERVEQDSEQASVRGKAERSGVVQRNTHALLYGHGERGSWQESRIKRPDTIPDGPVWQMAKVWLSRRWGSLLWGVK